MPRNPNPGKFDFGLTEAEEARAARLHRESIVIDLLSQHAGGNIFEYYPVELQAEFRKELSEAKGMAGMTAALRWPYEASRRGKSHLIADWFREGGLGCGSYGIRVHDGLDPDAVKAEELTIEHGKLPWIKYVTTAGEIRQARRDGLTAFFANCQPVTPAPRDIKAFDRAYEKGLRSFMLTYNRMDHIGTGCTERVDTGISMFGVDVVKHLNDIGMIVDTSHCGHLTTMDACRHSKRPVTANHTTARSIYHHARGKSNEALRAIAATGGVIGVVTVPFFLGRGDTTMNTMLDHIDYIADLVGWQHVAIGTDWPMQVPDDILKNTLQAEAKSIGFRDEDDIDVIKRLIGFDDVRDFPNVTRGLVKRGYSDEQIKGILGENFLRVFKDVCG